MPPREDPIMRSDMTFHRDAEMFSLLMVSGPDPFGNT